MAAPSRRRPAPVPVAALVGRPRRDVVRGTLVTPWRRTPEKGARELKIDEPIRIPGGVPKLLDAMSVAELDRVIGGLATPPVPKPALAKIVAGYRHRLAGLGQLNAQLLAQARDADRKVVSELAAELRGLAQELEAALRG